MNEELVKFVYSYFSTVHGLKKEEVDALTVDKAKEFADKVGTESQTKYNDGLIDGQKKQTKILLTSIAKATGIEIGENEVSDGKNAGEILLPKLKEKLGVSESNQKEESETVKNLKSQYEKRIDDLTKEKETALSEAKKQVETEVQKLQLMSIADSLLRSEGYHIPNDANLQKEKMELAELALDRKGYKYEKDATDGKFYRVDNDGVRVRENGKPISFNQDMGNIFQATHGRLPADQKDGGKLPDGSGDDSAKTFDWKDISNSAIIPKSLDEGLAKLNDPLVSGTDKRLILTYVEQEQANEKK